MMSKLAVHVEHFKKGAVAAIANHIWYKRGKEDTHSNQDIDPARSENNIALLLPEKSLYKDVKQLVDKAAGRVTAHSVWVSEWIIYPPEDLQNPLTADPDKLKKYYGFVLEWMRTNGYHPKMAVIHMDETTVHMHVDTVPITLDGRLSRKDIYTRSELNHIHTSLSKYLAEQGYDIQRGESTKGKQVRSKSVPEFKKDAEKQKEQLLETIVVASETLQQQAELISENTLIIQEQEEQMQQAEEWMSQIPDWPTYEAEAQSAWNILDSFRKLMQETFSSSRIFRNKKAEKALLNAIENVRDGLMTTLSALIGYEARERVPEPQKRSKALMKSLDSLIEDAAAAKPNKELPGRSRKNDEIQL